MEIIRASSRSTKKASSEYFTGIVWQDPIIAASEPRVRALKVAFEPALVLHGIPILLVKLYMC